MLDRTAEFRSCVAIYNKSHHLGKRKTQERTQGEPPKRASEFFSIASGISKDIHNTSEKLQRLAQLCQKKSIFEDHTTAIQELTYIIKQDLAKITENVKQLQAQGKDKAQAGQGAIHVESVVGSLNMGVNTATRSFKDILEVRTKNMRESRTRTDAFVHAGTGLHGSGIASAGGTSNSPVYAPDELRARKVGTWLWRAVFEYSRANITRWCIAAASTKQSALYTAFFISAANLTHRRASRASLRVSFA
jgi:syntaxin 5